MLRHVAVSGFKSLNGFAMDINPGLNVLVGPNGSGKTNIIRLFEFISNLTSYSIAEAISKSGGAGDVFNRDYDEDDEYFMMSTIHLSLSGDGFAWDRFASSAEETNYVYYFVESEIEFSSLEDVLHFNNQEIRLCVLGKKPEKPIDAKENYNFTIRMSRASGVTVSHGNAHHTKESRKLLETVNKYKSFIDDLNASGDHFIGGVMTRFDPLFMRIEDDVSLGQVYNVLPSKVREPEDIARPPVINQDGSGLAATLNRLKKSAVETKSIMVPRSTRSTRFSPESYERVKTNFLLVNGYFKDIDVRGDNYDNRLRVYATLNSKKADAVVLPLNVLSDGTIKWLTVVTAIETSKSYFAIEEPENFLHPAMQKEFIEIVRSVFGHDDYRFAVVTTHSETLLNTLKPEEIVTVAMDDGRTSATRFSDPARIRDEINRTGFGLGYYYVGGSLE